MTYRGLHTGPGRPAPAAIKRQLDEAADADGIGLPWSVNPQLATSTTNVGVANRTQFFRVHGRALIDTLSIYVGVQSGNIALEVWRSTGRGMAQYPATRLVTTGSIACPAAGRRDITLPSEVLAGPDCYYAVSADNVTATFNSCPTTTGLTDSMHGFLDSTFPPPASNGGLLTVSNRLICIIGSHS